MRPRLSWLLATGLVVGFIVLWNITSAGQARTSDASQRTFIEKTTRGNFSPALTSTVPDCYTWDFLNNTGQDATGLVINLKGITSLTDVYTGVLNPFGAPDPSSGYNSTTNVYSLIFSNGTVPDSGMAEIGICANQASLRLDTVQPPFYWVVSGSPVTPDPLFAGLDFNWINADHLQVHLYNEQSTPLTAFSFEVLTPSSPLSLDDLNDSVASTLQLASDQISDPLMLDGGASITFDVFLSQANVQVAFGDPVLLEAVLSTQDDPTNSIHLIAQTAQPFAQVLLPLIKK